MRKPYPYREPLQLSAPNPVSESPTVWFLKKYWWVSVPVIVAFVGRFRERQKKGTLTAYNMLEDFSNITAPGLGALGVIALIRQEHADALDRRLDTEYISDTQRSQQ